MSKIVACPVTQLHQTTDHFGASHIITLMNSGAQVDYPTSIPSHKRLKLEFNDIVKPQVGLTAASAQHMQQFLTFVHEWDQKAPLLIHCWAGISRSTAGAYIAQCALNKATEPEVREFALALREASPSATPNIHLVQLADDALGYKGAMVRAIQLIGRGEDAFEGIPFSIPIR